MSEFIKYDMDSTPIEKITLETICGSETNQTISFWAPRREEIQRFIEVAKAMHKGSGKPKILEVGCGSGLLAYLLAQTGEVEVIAMDPDETLIKNSLYKHENLKFEIGDSTKSLEQYKNKVDVVLNSWMPCGLNLTPEIRNINAKAIIYVKERESTGIPGYEYYNYKENGGTLSEEDYVSYEPGDNYKKEYTWDGPAVSALRYIADEIKTGNRNRYSREMCNFIEIQFRKDIPTPNFPTIKISDDEKYAWEKDLEKIIGKVSPIEEISRFGFY